MELGPTLSALGHVLYVEAQVELGLTIRVVLGVLTNWGLGIKCNLACKSRRPGRLGLVFRQGRLASSPWLRGGGLPLELRSWGKY